MKKLSYVQILGIGFVILFVFGGSISSVSSAPVSQADLELRMVLPWEPSGLDPHTAYEAAVQIIDYQVVEPLVAYDFSQEGPDYPLVRRLATNMVWNDDRTVITFTLREKVTFHDGTPFNADAVVWNFNRIKNLSEAGFSPFQYNLYVNALDYMDNGVTDISWANTSRPFPIINSTTKTDDFEVELKLNFPYPIEPLLPMMAIISPTAHAAEYAVPFTVARNDLVGTGPFNFTRWDPTEKRASFVRNDNYWRTPSAVTHLYFDFFNTADEAVIALQTGDIDYFPNPPGTSLQLLRDDPNIDVVEGPSMINYNFMPMNTQNLTKEFRQALVYGINMSYIKQELLSGFAGDRSAIVPKNAEFYNPEFAPPDYNLTHARKILIDAGLAGSLTLASTDQDWLDKAETDPIKDLIYTYFFSESFGTWQDVGLWLNSSVNKLGMNIILHPVGDGEIWGYFWSDELRSTTHLCQPTGWGFETRDSLLQIVWIFLSTSGYNYAGYHNAEFDALYVDAIKAQTVAEKQSVMNQIQELANIEDPPFLWTWAPRAVSATRTGWQGARVGFFYGDIHCYYMNKGDWEAPDEEELGKEINIPGFEMHVFVILSLASVAAMIVLTLRKRK